MSPERRLTLDEVVRTLVRDALREELAPLVRRNVTASHGADDSYLSVIKAAQVADVAPGTIRAWIRAGRLTSKRAGRVLRVSRSELAQFMAGAATGPSGVEAERRATHLFGQGRALRTQSA